MKKKIEIERKKNSLMRVVFLRDLLKIYYEKKTTPFGQPFGPSTKKVPFVKHSKIGVFVFVL